MKPKQCSECISLTLTDKGVWWCVDKNAPTTIVNDCEYFLDRK